MYTGGQGEGGVVVALVDTSTLPVNGATGVVSVIGRRVTGLIIVVRILGGALVEIVVRGFSGVVGTAGSSGVTVTLVVAVVTFNVELSGRGVVLGVVASTAEVAVVMTGRVVVGG